MEISRRSLFTLAAALGLTGEAAAAEKGVTFPFRVTRNQPWTAVFVDRSKDAQAFVIDTGSNTFAISNKAAASLGLPRVTKSQIQALVGRADVPFYFAREVVVANAEREREVYLAGIVLDSADTVSGLIPSPANGVIAFDFDAQTISLSGHHVPDVSGHMQLPLVATGASQFSGSLDRMGEMSRQDETRLTLDLRPNVQVELDGEKVEFLVDTGCSQSLVLSPDYVKAHGLWERKAGAVETRVPTLVDTVSAKVARLTSLKLGSVRFEHPIVTIPDPKHANADGAFRFGGLIGMELLRRLNFVIDPYSRRMWMKPSSAIQDVYRYDRAGVDIDIVDGALKVTALTEGGPAARAGLKLGDRVTGWAGADGYQGLLWALKGAPGSTVRLQVDRDGGPQLIGIKLEELI
jgi:predicted aspartyl protease